jgi:hypothetical protein
MELLSGSRHVFSECSQYPENVRLFKANLTFENNQMSFGAKSGERGG